MAVPEQSISAALSWCCRRGSISVSCGACEDPAFCGPRRRIVVMFGHTSTVRQSASRQSQFFSISSVKFSLGDRPVCSACQVATQFVSPALRLTVARAGPY